ncbi:efflux RND transporter periplasmic adaptor subunit [Rubellimicrobium arenae]|uniref:efflux RND transporter periplasmic adaptor subunit n=1 Tax=Rubellimicrobium arenae TaxID=2817372 RepID=UPI001B3131E2|nr:efflux RND transporter periplasmic adaptor subunit [Rubellimicrobium arenae]
MSGIQRFVVPVSIVVFSSLVPGLAPSSLLAQGGEEQGEGVVPAVTVALAAERALVQRVAIAGTLIPREEVLVYPEISGYPIIGLYVDVGDHVETGQLIAHLDDHALRRQLAQAEAENARAVAGMRQARNAIASSEATVSQVNQALDRTKALHENGTATQANLDDATAAALTAAASLASAQDGFGMAAAQFQQAQAALDLARINLEHAEITAPVKGLISVRNGQIGSMTSLGGEPIYRIIRDGLVEVEAEVVETELGLIAVDDPVELEVAGLDPLEGSVRLVSPVVDPANRLGTVRIRLEAREGLRPGLFAAGWIAVAERDALAVPASAVITDAEESYVLRVQDGVIERQPVVAGLLWEEWREVVSGLEPGDQVVARAAAFFSDGDVIRPVLTDDHTGEDQ